MAKIFTVVLSWNNFQDTQKCLRSLLQESNSQVVLVDNASTEGSALKLQKQFSQNNNFHFLQNKSNLGFAAGNNVGIKYALAKGADYIFVLNNDTQVAKSTIGILKETLEKNLSAGIAVPKIFFPDGKNLWYAGGKISFILGGSIHNVKSDDSQSSREVNFATGAAMMLKADCLKKGGLFDEKFFAYNEDTDLSWRFLKYGFKILYVPKAIVFHKAGGSFGVRTFRHLYFDSRNKILFMKKHGRWWQWLIFLPNLIGKNFFHNLFGAILKPRKDKWPRVAGAYLGIRDGLLGRFGKRI